MASTHQRLHDTEEIKGSSNRAFGFVVGGALAILGLLPLRGGGDPHLLLLVGGGLLGGLGLVAPTVLTPLNAGWTRLGILMGKVVNPLVLGLMFFLFVTPMAVLMRLGGKKFLALDFDPGATSYWIPRDPPGPEPESIVYPF
ncbi:MAG: hypothetical protein KDA24_10240 [Deltaproteobacteria bacterium]|nr:hypothetical protein [Deltaproteobacteria bacterium]